MDTPFINNVSQKYVTFATENPDLYVVRKLIMGVSSLIVASVLCLNLYVNEVKVIPGFVFAMVVIFSAVTLRKYSKKWGLVISFATINTILSAVTYFATVKFYSDSSLSKLETYNAYNLLVGLSIAESVSFIITFIFTLIMVWEVYGKHTDISFTKEKQSYKAEKTYFLKGAVACTVSAIMMALANVYYVYANHPYLISNVKWVVEYSSVIVLGISLVFIGILIYNLGNVINSIKCHYKLDI